MPKGYERQPGIRALNVPCTKDEMVPNQRHVDKDRGALKNVPREGICHIGDFGAPSVSGPMYPAYSEPTASPASAKFTPGRPTLKRHYED